MSAASRADVLRPARSPLEPGPGRTPRPVLNVAIVTEDGAVAASCERILRNAGHHVRSARHSGHAHLLCLSGQRIDVLLVDMVMSDSSGPGLARRMRRHNPDLKCVYLAPAGSRCETDNVLVRPFTAEDLLDRVAQAPDGADS